MLRETQALHDSSFDTRAGVPDAVKFWFHFGPRIVLRTPVYYRPMSPLLGSIVQRSRVMAAKTAARWLVAMNRAGSASRMYGMMASSSWIEDKFFHSAVYSGNFADSSFDIKAASTLPKLQDGDVSKFLTKLACLTATTALSACDLPKGLAEPTGNACASPPVSLAMGGRFKQTAYNPPDVNNPWRFSAEYSFVAGSTSQMNNAGRQTVFFMTFQILPSGLIKGLSISSPMWIGVINDDTP